MYYYDLSKEKIFKKNTLVYVVNFYLSYIYYGCSSLLKRNCPESNITSKGYTKFEKEGHWFGLTDWKKTVLVLNFFFVVERDVS